MPAIPIESARTAQAIFNQSTFEARDRIRVKRFSSPENNDGTGLRAVNILLGSGDLVINPQGQVDINPQKLINSQ